MALRDTPAHTKIYGGMTACQKGFHGRITDGHLSPAFRMHHPSMHYTMYDLPGTTSCFYIWAPYGRNEDVAEIVVGEAVMIGLLGLYENQDYYNILKGLNIPSCISGIHCPLVGLN